MLIPIQIFIAWFYSHILEWTLHKHVFHNVKNKNWFKKHFAFHHGSARKRFMVDKKYTELINFRNDFEIKGGILLLLIHSPLLFFAPAAYVTLICCALSYLLLHRRCHQDVFWGRKWMPWHYDHHMAPNQHQNWGVRLPIIDWVMGTRKKYKGSKREIITHIIIKNQYNAKMEN